MFIWILSFVASVLTKLDKNNRRTIANIDLFDFEFKNPQL